ncbi:hypothetical protein DFS34DRAFT_620224 [Phlyctochytrium arcticum]|nr:hypothetical protein DFS34DRAFT_620224 [Phlyctochytrium arcticum]
MSLITSSLSPRKLVLLILFDMYLAQPESQTVISNEDIPLFLLEELEEVYYPTSPSDNDARNSFVYMSKANFILCGPCEYKRLRRKFPNTIYIEKDTWLDVLDDKMECAMQSVEDMLAVFAPFEDDLTEEDINARYSMTSPYGVLVRELVLDHNDLKNDLVKADLFLTHLRTFAGQSSENEIVPLNPESIDTCQCRVPQYSAAAESELLLLTDSIETTLQDPTSVIDDAFREKLRITLQNLQCPAKAEWLRYTCYIRDREFEQASRALERIFLMQSGRLGRRRSDWMHHLALFNLGNLLAKFEYYDLALETCSRAIPLAQEVGDEATLGYLREQRQLISKMAQDHSS